MADAGPPGVVGFSGTVTVLFQRAVHLYSGRYNLVIGGVPAYLWLGLDGLYLAMIVIYAALVIAIWWTAWRANAELTPISLRQVIAESATPLALASMFAAWFAGSQSEAGWLLLGLAMLCLITGLICRGIPGRERDTTLPP